MPKTGEKCEVSGIYEGDCKCTIEIEQGATFPPCRSCDRAVHWTFVRPL